MAGEDVSSQVTHTCIGILTENFPLNLIWKCPPHLMQTTRPLPTFQNPRQCLFNKGLFKRYGISNLNPGFKFKQIVVELPVVRVIWARIENSDHNKNMLEVRSNVLWCEGKSTRFLKHNGDYVISNMPFSQELQQKEQMRMSIGELKLKKVLRLKS